MRMTPTPYRCPYCHSGDYFAHHADCRACEEELIWDNFRRLPPARQEELKRIYDPRSKMPLKTEN